MWTDVLCLFLSLAHPHAVRDGAVLDRRHRSSKDLQHQVLEGGVLWFIR